MTTPKQLFTRATNDYSRKHRETVSHPEFINWVHTALAEYTLRLKPENMDRLVGAREFIDVFLSLSEPKAEVKQVASEDLDYGNIFTTSTTVPSSPS